MNINENPKASTTQNAQIAAYLQAGNSITALEALELFGCFRPIMARQNHGPLSRAKGKLGGVVYQQYEGMTKSWVFSCGLLTLKKK